MKHSNPFTVTTVPDRAPNRAVEQTVDQSVELTKLVLLPTVFMLPAVLVLALSYRCLGRGDVEMFNVLGPFVFYCGHAILLTLLFLVAILVTYNVMRVQKISVTIFTAILLIITYLITGFLSWWIVYFEMLNF